MCCPLCADNQCRCTLPLPNTLTRRSQGLRVNHAGQSRHACGRRRRTGLPRSGRHGAPGLRIGGPLLRPRCCGLRVRGFHKGTGRPGERDRSRSRFLIALQYLTISFPCPSARFQKIGYRVRVSVLEVVKGGDQVLRRKSLILPFAPHPPPPSLSFPREYPARWQQRIRSPFLVLESLTMGTREKSTKVLLQYCRD